MSVRRINNWWWVDFRFDHMRYRVRCPSNKRADAQNYEALLQNRLFKGLPLHGETHTPPKPTFAEIAARWQESYGANCRPARRIGLQYTIKSSLNRFFGEMPIDKIGTVAVERYKAQLVREKLSPLTINGKIGVLRLILAASLEAGEIKELPKIVPLRAPKSPYDVLTEEEVRKLLSDHSERVAAELVCMAYFTGMRIGELLALDWKEVNLETREVCVRQSVSMGVVGPTKNYQERWIPFGNEILNMLTSLPRREGRVFVDWKGRPVTYNTACCRLKKLCERVGLRQVHWHALRHTFASTIAMAGAPVNAIQALLGHAEITTTMRYAHVNDLALRDAINTLPQTNPA